MCNKLDKEWTEAGFQILHSDWSIGISTLIGKPDWFTGGNLKTRIKLINGLAERDKILKEATSFWKARDRSSSKFIFWIQSERSFVKRVN